MLMTRNEEKKKKNEKYRVIQLGKLKKFNKIELSCNELVTGDSKSA